MEVSVVEYPIDLEELNSMSLELFTEEMTGTVPIMPFGYQ